MILLRLVESRSSLTIRSRHRERGLEPVHFPGDIAGIGYPFPRMVEIRILSGGCDSVLYDDHWSGPMDHHSQDTTGVLRHLGFSASKCAVFASRIGKHFLAVRRSGKMLTLD